MEHFTHHLQKFLVGQYNTVEELAQATAKELGDAKAYTVNVTDNASVTQAVEQAHADFGAIHINVNCAGIGSASRTVGRDGAMDIGRFNFVGYSDGARRDSTGAASSAWVGRLFRPHFDGHTDLSLIHI